MYNVHAYRISVRMIIRAATKVVAFLVPIFGTERRKLMAQEKPVRFHYERVEHQIELGETVHNLNGTEYKVEEILSRKNILFRNMRNGNYVVGVNTDFFVRYPEGENIGSLDCEYGIEWGHGYYMEDTLSAEQLSYIRKEYGLGVSRESVILSEGGIKMSELLMNEEFPEDVSRRVAQEFRKVTYEKFHEIKGLSSLDMEAAAREYINRVVEKNDLDVEIIGVVLHGSRARGIEREDSDIDFVVEYKGDIKEDAFFDLLHEKESRINNIDLKVDINPIRAEETGTLASYLPMAEEYLQELEALFLAEDLINYVTTVDYDNYVDYVQSVLGEMKTISELSNYIKGHILHGNIKPIIDYLELEIVEMDEEQEDDIQNAKELINRLNEYKKRLFVDIDGTLAEFKTVDTLETLYEEGYFLNLMPHENVVAAINDIIKNHPEIDVYIMSSVLSDSKYALAEKNAWIDKYLPGIVKEHRIFPPCGENKLDYVPDGIRETDFLLDDYTYNLTLWQPPARGIKLLNGINHTKGTWQHDRLDFNKSGVELAENITSIMTKGGVVKDVVPVDNEMQEIQNKVSYYTLNLGGTGLGEDVVPVTYSNFENALNVYMEAQADGKTIGYTYDGKYSPIASFNAVEMKHTMMGMDTDAFDLVGNAAIEVEKSKEILRTAIYEVQNEEIDLGLEFAKLLAQQETLMEQINKLSDGIKRIENATVSHIPLERVPDTTVENKKYRFTDDTIKVDGKTLHRIQALRSFSDVQKWELGGYIESERNLSHKDNAWVYDDAKVFDNARVSDDASVSDNAAVYGNAVVYENAKVHDYAEVFGKAQVHGNADVYGDAWMAGNARICDNAKIFGKARARGNAELNGNYILSGNSVLTEKIDDISQHMEVKEPK